MAALLSLVCFLAALASAQSVVPSNTTLQDQQTAAESQLAISGAVSLNFVVAPLTSAAGLGQSYTSLNTINISGNLARADAQTQSDISASDVVFISCDTGTSPGFLDPSSVVTNVGASRPRAIVLYSLSSTWCDITSGSFSYGSIYTVTSAADALALSNQAFASTSVLSVTITPTKATHDRAGSQSSSTTGGPAPTTAVAMSILYSITGIITLLFLIIIATGAIRAHRHPERYGPRTGNQGRPRQSRAKGLARAMLETLPIVKFGDPEPTKPGTRDVELEDGMSAHTPDVTANPEAVGGNGDTASKTAPTPAVVASGLDENAQKTPVERSEAPAAVAVAESSELGCSICTEDFTTGEDVRVLPCKHKYHPACIDPWLLNVSGTCPLCRHDLRPAAEADGTAAEGDELPPPLSAVDAENEAATNAPHPHRASRYIALRGLHSAPPDERIAALRRLREQSQQEGAEPEADPEEPGRRSRLTGRLRDTFRIRTRRQNDEPSAEQ